MGVALDILAIVIAAGALALSGFLLYRNHFRGFRLIVRNAGRITVGKDPLSKLTRPYLAADIVFSNDGSSRGVVEDVAITLTSHTINVLFRSFLVITDRTKQWQKELMPPKAESFISFDLGPGQSMVKEISFVPADDNAEFTLDAGEYQATIWAMPSINQKWEKYDSFPFTISQEDVDEINKSSITSQPDGRLFINWKTRDKPTDIAERRLQDLKSHITDNS